MAGEEQPRQGEPPPRVVLEEQEALLARVQELEVLVVLVLAQALALVLVQELVLAQAQALAVFQALAGVLARVQRPVQQEELLLVLEVQGPLQGLEQAPLVVQGVIQAPKNYLREKIVSREKDL